ncbi:SURF1 family protein [Streptomyces sp. AC536]|uniref:SURF1 family cytochrome oxidase biogenesis protein n=1 Tax=Streptomyces buecherae TaxID=2763006 RepID=UPI00164E7C7E|nr:SURF1 family cytochrome oxidase biogenesis protein [Streptomyces buecherae]MBC3986160.1 SURF1 family protein [Streptomyces buecherae]QNJ43129.1 SURF1 family protein [Streptomyces buecherae]
MYRFLLTRQWVILTLVGLVLIPVMIELGFWQFGRHEQRVEHNERVSKSLDAPAVPIGELTGVGRDVPKQTAMRKVTVSGTYDPRHEVVVRQRTGSDDQSIGYFVVTPLLLADGNAVLVNRGWIPAPGNLTQFPDVPAPPTGEVTVTGRLKADETTGSSGIKDKKGLPPRQVMLINSERQAETVGRPLLGGYVELTDSKPRGAHQPEPVPAPDTSGIGSHMAYAVQWWLFTAAVPVGWVVLFRRELRDQAAAAAKAAKDAEAAREKAAAEPEAPGASDAAPAAAGADTTSRPYAQADAAEPEAETAEPGAEAARSDAGPDAKADMEPGAEPVAPAEHTASVARSAAASD